MKPIYSSKQVQRDADIRVYTRESENYIKQQRYEAAVMIATQKERFNIRTYPETEQDYHNLVNHI